MAQRFRVPLGFVLAVLVFYLARPTPVTMLAGAPVAIAGLLTRLLAAGVIRKDAALATDGLYSWTRNPLYFGSTLVAIGFAIAAAHPLAAAALLVPSLIVYPAVIRREEAHLEKLFGEEFRRYRASTPAFIPRMGGPLTRFSFEQYCRNREYQAAMGFAAAMAILAAKWWIS